jgi:inhibitor of KinA
MVISDASDCSVLVTFGGVETYPHVLSLFRSLRAQPLAGVRNLHPAYGSLLIEFDSLRLTHQAMHDCLSQRVFDTQEPAPAKLVTIPVHYNGPDLADVARLHQLSEAQVIDLHTSTDYTVYFLGFVPGFAYLGMLPEQLATPRLPDPRAHVPPGSVGLADRQTGIYPVSTPGGWRLIGRTPLPITVGLLEPGDQVRFEPLA